MNKRAILGGSQFEVTMGDEIVDPSGSGRTITVAIKRPARAHRHDPEARAALEREARFLSLARHPSVPRLLSVGSDEHGPFLVEERVLGESLEAMLERGVEPLALSVAAPLLARAAEALGALHDLADEAGPLELVHGDPSPGNVLVSTSGEVRFVDFGASHHRGALDRPRGRGTPPFAAPELTRGEALPSRETDVYALAAVAIRILTGRPLRPEADPAARLVAVAERGIDLAPLRAAALPEPLRAALAELVAHDPRERHPRFDRLLAALAGP